MTTIDISANGAGVGVIVKGASVGIMLNEGNGLGLLLGALDISSLSVFNVK